MGRPLVYLIGAGPGDPGLITVKGLKCIEEADVIVYDYLANSRFLAHAREDAEVIYVGKKGFTQHVTQEEINAVIVQKALEEGGKTVARLKGGDPFIFGRGGEEALALVDAGIRFEVVPGISSGYAAPAYAGIPVTHRGITTEMAFVTGHEDPTKSESDIDWEHLAKGVGTVCFFMGIKNLPNIVENLTKYGRPATTPVALVRWGTTAKQEVLVGTLATIAQKAAEVGFKAPAITVVGEVVNLREKLAWFDTRPLFGKTVVVTRSRAQASALTDALEDLGAEVLEFPAIKVVDPESFEPVDDAIRNLDLYSWLVLTSVNGVERFFDRLEYADKDARALAGLRVAAIGPATAAACIARGVRPDYVPDEYRAEGVLEGLCERGVGAGTNVLLARALEAREVLPEKLRERGARVDVVPVYRTIVGEGEPGVLDRLRDGDIDAVTFTSSSTVTNFITLTEGIDLADALKGALVASIGPITSDTARAAGLTVGVEAEEYTIPGLVTAVAKHFGVDVDEDE
ncbi:MAG: uroporphyrinogen-III C-methyltransferase [Actinobacteria bacterium HGW-Actinobacteria-1]|jgi:uroporphyrinogen III methyltransferase/synthase|nr:MAG: uroporphyrinogen-III C-methyltransferase [Actinobacteria bacterium HGW-Actinobacteria-1]